MTHQPKFSMIDVARPTPVGPFSHAAEADGWVFFTGQMPADHDAAAARRRRRANPPRDGQPDSRAHGPRPHARQRGERALFLTEFKRDYDTMNAVYRSYFLPKLLPARTCIGVTGLARDALVEIDFVARRP